MLLFPIGVIIRKRYHDGHLSSTDAFVQLDELMPYYFVLSRSTDIIDLIGNNMVSLTPYDVCPLTSHAFMYTR